MSYGKETENHLGGYLVTNNPWGDPGTWSPEIWEKIIKDYNVKSVLDIGCGLGYSTRFFQSKGLKVRGVEGGPNAVRSNLCPESIISNDYTKGSAPLLDDTYDLIWCCEFVEHVEEKYAPNFLKDFCRGKVVAMTFANIGQEGYHHVNCQSQDYWIEKLTTLGYIFKGDYTELLRGIARDTNIVENNPFQHAGHLTKILIFEKES